MGGGRVSSATTPLNISAGVLSIDLSAYTTTAGLTTLLAGKISTTHDANKIGATDATHLFDFKSQTLTLRNGAGVQAVLSIDNGGNVSIGSDGIVMIPILNTCSPSLLRLSDSGSTSLLLQASLTGALTCSSVQWVDADNLTTQLRSYTTSTALTTLLATKQATISVAAGAFLSGATIAGSDLKWLTNGVPTIGGVLGCLHFESGFSIAGTPNLPNGQNDLDITAIGVTDAEMKAHIANSAYMTEYSGLTSIGSVAAGTVVLGWIRG